MKRHVTCFVKKAGFEPKTLGTKAERYDYCATRPVHTVYKILALQLPLEGEANCRVSTDCISTYSTMQCIPYSERQLKYMFAIY
jgi:hypothetical protein